MSKTLTEVIAEIEDVINEYKQKAVNVIAEQKRQNPALKPLGENSVCFTIKFSDLSPDSVLSPHFYDWEWQFDAVIKKMKSHTSLQALKNTVEKIVETGKLDGQRFHPEVIEVLRSVL